uniref:Uncharacterized protein n=1 Tax=Bracon brevicornis TaxID=1563983 RepID=A0A6V7LRC0_9HYME
MGKRKAKEIQGKNLLKGN